MNEAKIENVRRFVRAYGELAGFVDRIDDLQHQILLSLKDACESSPTFETNGSILGRELRQAEMISRKGAWIAQHQLNTRAFCVGNQLVQLQGDYYFSALTRQLDHLGYQSKPAYFSSFMRQVEARKWVKRVDAVLVQPEQARITIVKTCSYDQVRGQLDVDQSILEPNLFVPKPRRVYQRLAPSKILTTLTIAEWVMRSSYPDYDVRTILLIVDPASCSWRHEAYDVTGTTLQEVSEDTHDLRPYQQCWSGEANELQYANVPNIPTAQALNKLSVDRATRTRMVLEQMWRKQAVCDGLSSMTASEITKAVQKSYLIHYTKDWRRHDLEDCLLTGGFIERPRYEKKCYVLTPLGVYEALVSRSQMTPAESFVHGRDVATKTLSLIHQQARLLARYAEGEQVIK